MRRPPLRVALVPPVAYLPALVLAFGFAIAFPSPARADRQASVPRVEGLELAQATQRIASAHLQAEIVWTAEGRPGRVQAQRPAAGTRVATGTIVELMVTRRLKVETIVPDVVGLAEDEAVAALEDVYVVELEERSVSSRRVGEIVAQEPQAGARLLFRGVLRLVVGRAQRAPLRFPLPDVRHMVLDEAESVLLDLGLVPVPTFVRARAASQGRVRRQDPAPATHLTYGARVALEVGIARTAAHRVRVPSLVGLEPTEAAQALGALGLGVRTERMPSRFSRDTVIRQNPQAGSQATAGSAVRLLVAFPAGHTHVPARVAVPQLQGVTLAEAFARARQAGIQLQVRRRRGSGARDRDLVVAQRPTARAAVPLGTRVRIEVPFGVRVPDLVGVAPDAAALRIWEAGLRLEFDGGLRVRRQGVLVVAQTPKAGTVVAPDTVVHAVLARDAGAHRVLVPDVREATVTRARALLELAGLQTRLTGPPIPAGATTQVIAQMPVPGTYVPRDSTVQVAYRLAVGGVPGGALAFVRVPDLRGRSLLAAQALLHERGLAGIVSTVRGPGPKVVTGQSPAPGTQVRRGVKVRFTVRR